MVLYAQPARNLGASPGCGQAEPYPCRRTTRFVIGGPSDLDEEMPGWIAQAYWFAHRGGAQGGGRRVGGEGAPPGRPMRAGHDKTPGDPSQAGF